MLCMVFPVSECWFYPEPECEQGMKPSCECLCTKLQRRKTQDGSADTLLVRNWATICFRIGLSRQIFSRQLQTRERRDCCQSTAVLLWRRLDTILPGLFLLSLPSILLLRRPQLLQDTARSLASRIPSPSIPQSSQLHSPAVLFFFNNETFDTLLWFDH